MAHNASCGTPHTSPAFVSDGDSEPVWLDGTDPSSPPLKPSLASARVPGEDFQGATKPSPIVCHRGYHCIHDSVSRPIENTLPAYATAWKLGFHLAECDITLTLDGEIFLCHDSDFQRLHEKDADDKSRLEMARIRTNELRSSELDDLRLLDGSNPTRLSDVLECAEDLSNESPLTKQLVVEIKGHEPGEAASADQAVMGSACAEALCTHLEQHPAQLPFISVIMSFDVDAMRVFSDWKMRLQKSSFSSVRFVKELAKIKFLLLRTMETWNMNDQATIDESRVLVETLRLDGLYCEYQPEMVDPARSFDATSHSITGVWNRAVEQPDGLEICDMLVSCGVQYINSDLPGGLLEGYYSNGLGLC